MTTAAFAALALAPSAFAHATLVETTPSNDAVLARSPGKVVLRFDEAVETTSGSLQVFDEKAARIDDGEVTRPQPDKVAVGVPATLPKATYTVAWRAISADSHPVHGAFVFHVGKPGSHSGGVVAQVIGSTGGSTTVDRTFAFVRFVCLLAILLCVGGAVALVRVLRDASAGGRSLAWMWLAIASGLVAVSSLAWIGLEGAEATGLGFSAAVKPAVVREVLDTRFGHVWIARAVLALVLLVLAVVAAGRDRRSRPIEVCAVGVAAAIALTPALSGHARVEGLVGVVSDWLHVLSAGLWVGGLAFLALSLVQAGGDRWSLAKTAVPRFSSLALVSVTVLVAAGVVSGFLEIRSWWGLFHTTYGQLLLAKVVILLPLLALGALNNRRSVPRLRGGTASTPERRRFLRTVTVELVLMVAIVGVTAVLVAERPAKAVAASAAGPVSRDARIGPFDLNLVVDPARTGSNQIHLYLLDHATGQPAEVDETRLSATLPAAGIGPLRFTATPAGPGHVVVTNATFPLAGTWRLLVEVRKGDFDEWNTTLIIPIRKDT